MRNGLSWVMVFQSVILAGWLERSKNHVCDCCVGVIIFAVVLYILRVMAIQYSLSAFQKIRIKFFL
jgi:hypothetical protein